MSDEHKPMTVEELRKPYRHCGEGRPPRIADGEEIARLKESLATRDEDIAVLRAKVAVLEAERDEARDWVRRMVNGTTVTCVYCGHAYPPGSPTHGADALKDHIRACEKHPMREVEAELEQLRAKVAALEAETGKWRETVKAWIDADVGEDKEHLDKLVEMVDDTRPLPAPPGGGR